MKKIILFVMIISLSLLSGCGVSKAVKAPKYNPNFDYTPPERATPRSAGITISLINPVFADDNPKGLVPPYSTFIENMGDDFEEMIIAKGFSLRGPFKTRDEMVYGDKKNSDIALEIKITLEEDGALQLFNKGAYYTISGTFYHFGKIIIEATDPFTGEKFWKKTISLPRKEIVAQGNLLYNRNPTEKQMLGQDTGIYNPVAKALEEYYQEAIKTAWKHIDVEEMKMIKKEIEKAKTQR